jgi:hypothetical protein
MSDLRGLRGCVCLLLGLRSLLIAEPKPDCSGSKWEDNQQDVLRSPILVDRWNEGYSGGCVEVQGDYG